MDWTVWENLEGDDRRKLCAVKCPLDASILLAQANPIGVFEITHHQHHRTLKVNNGKIEVQL